MDEKREDGVTAKHNAFDDPDFRQQWEANHTKFLKDERKDSGEHRSRMIAERQREKPEQP